MNETEVKPDYGHIRPLYNRLSRAVAIGAVLLGTLIAGAAIAESAGPHHISAELVLLGGSLALGGAVGLDIFRKEDS